jgi:exosortase
VLYWKKDMATVTGEQPIPAAAVRPIPWIAVGWFAILIVVVYFPVLNNLVHNWINDEDMGHAFFVPLVAGYMVWQRRDRLMEMEWKPSRWGLLLLVWGVAQSYIGTLGVELFLQRTAVLITFVGVLLTFGGFGVLRELAFPLLLLPFMVPIPAIVYNRVTLPLQIFASTVAENILNFINIPTLREGNVLQLPSQSLNVAEACSGIRSLLSLTFLSLVYSYFFDQRVWMRVVLFFATIPIAILANALRVTMTGILSEVNPDLAKGFSHELEGWIIFLVALGMLIAAHTILSKILDRGKPAVVPEPAA